MIGSPLISAPALSAGTCHRNVKVCDCSKLQAEIESHPLGSPADTALQITSRLHHGTNQIYADQRKPFRRADNFYGRHGIALDFAVPKQRRGDVCISGAGTQPKGRMSMDREMMRALQMDAAMLESMGAGEQPLAFEGAAVGMRLTDAANDLWQVHDLSGNILGSDLSMDDADAMLLGGAS